MRLVWYLIIFSAIIPLSTIAQADSKTGFPLIYKQDFEEPEAIYEFVYSDPAPWFMTGGKDGGMALEYAGRGDYEPRVRSPLIIGLIDNLVLGDFILEADVLQTGSEYGHRDMCIFFGFQDSTLFYYVHLASQADPVAHTVHIVNDLPRKSIVKERTDGIRWIDGHWHHIRLERRTGDGEISCIFMIWRHPSWWLMTRLSSLVMWDLVPLMIPARSIISASGLKKAGKRNQLYS